MATILFNFRDVTPAPLGARAAGIPAAAAEATAGPGQHRKDIANLTAEELAALREAFARVFEIGGENGYQYWAGIHGEPPPWDCEHSTPLFTVWHRPYLYLFEKALQAVVPGVTLPYWDWTSLRAQREGLPAAYTARTSRDPGGVERPNPLHRADIRFPGSRFRTTSRNPGPLDTLRRLSPLVARAQTQRSYDTYNSAIENPHNGLHGWVGGTMGFIGYSAYDPIFWAHHANIDRLFAAWQAANPRVRPNASVMNSVLRPFGMTTEHVWNIGDLGYDYITSEAPRAAIESSRVMAAPLRGEAPPIVFSTAQVERDFRKAEMYFHDIDRPEESLEIRIFLNMPEANATTPLEGNPRYAGSLFVFGHGPSMVEATPHHAAAEAAGDAGPALDWKTMHNLMPFTSRVDITRALRAATRSAFEVVTTFVIVDLHGNPVPNADIDLSALSIVTQPTR